MRQQVASSILRFVDLYCPLSERNKVTDSSDGDEAQAKSIVF